MKRTPNWIELDLKGKCGTCSHYVQLVQKTQQTARGKCSLRNKSKQRSDKCQKYEEAKESDVEKLILHIAKREGMIEIHANSNETFFCTIDSEYGEVFSDDHPTLEGALFQLSKKLQVYWNEDHKFTEGQKQQLMQEIIQDFGEEQP